MSNGFKTYIIHQDSNYHKNSVEDEILHSHWLESSQLHDINQCYDIIKKSAPDLIIIDHYALDHLWERLIRTFSSCKIMVIDDLCDRKHNCDYLIDSTYGRTYSEYQKLINNNCKYYFGTDYSIINRDFKELRETAKNKRKAAIRNYKILITMGGVDINNISETIIDVLNEINITNPHNILLIIGKASPHKKNLIKKCHEKNIQYCIGVKNMPQLMVEYDIAIGALGVTAWERCVLYLPSINISISQNQEIIADKARAAGLIVINPSDISSQTIKLNLVKIISNYKNTSEIVGNICNGHGIEKIISIIDKIKNISNTLLRS